MNYNKVIMLGRLTRDPVLRQTNSGTSVTDFGLASTRVWKNQDGVQSEETCFVDVVAWGAQAELIHGSVKKGHRLHIEGRLKLEQWESKEGEKRSRLRIHMEGFQFIEPKGGTSKPAEPKSDDDVPF
jgi:single-strand DNA-binding protein